MSVTFSEVHQGEMVRERARALPGAALARVILIGTPGLLIAAPLWFGATDVAGSIAVVAASWVLLLLWVAQAMRSGVLSFSTYPVMLPAALLLVFTSVHWAMGISASVPATQLEWLRWAGYLALALVAGETFVSYGRLRWLAGALVVAGVGIALLGIAQHFTAGGKIYWMIEPSQGGWVFGPYVNRNHFAGLMELWIPVALGLALMPENRFVQRWIWCAAAMAMGAAVVLSASRGGLLVLGIEVAVLFVAAAALRGRQRAVIGLVVCIALVAGVIWFAGSSAMVSRFAELAQPGSAVVSEAAGHRLDAWKGTLQIFRENWLLGTGLNTFEPHFRAARTYYTDKVWTHAHNDFLQFVAETGVLGIALGLWLVIAAAREIGQNLRRTRHTATGAILIGFACGCLGLMVHGWLDFNFHVPANAASFVVLAAIVSRRGWDED